MKSDKRSFIVLHSHGGSCVEARSAGEALRRAYVPLGFKDARGVIEASIIQRKTGVGPFCAFLAKPALPEIACR